MYYNSDSSATTHTVELWCYVPWNYVQMHFDVISEGTRTAGNSFTQWTVYNTVTESGATPTSGLAYINSSIKIGMGAGKILYNNASGTNGNITLNETAANFSYIEILYSVDNLKLVNNAEQHYDAFTSVKVLEPNGKTVNMGGITMHHLADGGHIMQLVHMPLSISGTSMTRGTEYGLNLIANNSIGNYHTDTKLKIYRVIGYR